MAGQKNITSEARDTLPETNIAPENSWLEDQFPFGKAHFQGQVGDSAM